VRIELDLERVGSGRQQQHRGARHQPRRAVALISARAVERDVDLLMADDADTHVDAVVLRRVAAETGTDDGVGPPVPEDAQRVFGALVEEVDVLNELHVSEGKGVVVVAIRRSAGEERRAAADRRALSDGREPRRPVVHDGRRARPVPPGRDRTHGPALAGAAELRAGVLNQVGRERPHLGAGGARRDEARGQRDGEGLDDGADRAHRLLLFDVVAVSASRRT
jgi:hypothetical protein